MCESLAELEADHRGRYGTPTTFGMELFLALVNSFNRLAVVTKISVLDVETVPSPPLDTQGLMIRLFSFLKVDSKHHFFFILCQLFFLFLFSSDIIIIIFLFVRSHCIYLLLSFLRINKLLID